MRCVWVVRHGESEANAGLPSTSPDATLLTTKGHKQAYKFAEIFYESWTEFRVQTPGLFVTSKYIRTKQTAAPTFTCFDHVPREEWPVEEFTYLDPSKYVGSTVTEREPHVKAWWERADPEYRDGGGAESFADLLLRVRNLVNVLRDRKEDMTVIFSHGRFMRALLWFTLFEPGEPTRAMMCRFQQFDAVVPVPNATVLPMFFGEGSSPLVGPMFTP